VQIEGEETTTVPVSKWYASPYEATLAADHYLRISNEQSSNLRFHTGVSCHRPTVQEFVYFIMGLIVKCKLAEKYRSTYQLFTNADISHVFHVQPILKAELKRFSKTPSFETVFNDCIFSSDLRTNVILSCYGYLKMFNLIPKGTSKAETYAELFVTVERIFHDDPNLFSMLSAFKEGDYALLPDPLYAVLGNLFCEHYPWIGFEPATLHTVPLVAQN
jgi:hypothetical protein